MYKKQVTELQYTLNEGAIKLDKFEFETKKLSENLAALQKEKDVSCSIIFLTLHVTRVIFFRD